ncbi:MAG: hypothetical protein AAGF79_07355 [Pseudomonadota bacterium]
MNRRMWGAGAAAAVLALSASLVETRAQTVQGSDAALSDWGKVYEVLSHPRCVNCHVPADNRPRWSGPSYRLAEGEWAFHGMNISGGAERDGRNSIACSACHAQTNSELPHGPPGAPHWALAPVEMTWLGKSSAALCAQIKDPAQTGGRDLAAIADHIGHDALVLWGWDPGPGRAPAPFSAEETVSALIAWSDAGAPCPD